MSGFRSRVYAGTVVHKRLEPKRHAFSYRVFALCLDVDEIDTLAERLRLFSRGRTNLMSFHDRDHGARNGESIAVQARRLLSEAGLDAFGARIELLCYPRLLGYVFNPLSVYFGYDRDGDLGALIYEVTNTLGERKSYVIPVDTAGREATSVVAQHCAKELYVSPFTAGAGSYGFHVVPPAERIVVGVDFREDGRPVLKTHFSGERQPLSDGTIARLLLGYPLMTLKVIAAIHLEAARLWLKGVPVRPYHASPRFSSSAIKPSARKPANV